MKYEPDSVLLLPRALPGFPSENEFVILQQPEHFPLVYMQSLSTADPCFLALPVLSVEHDYDLCLSEEDADLLDLQRAPLIGREALCLVLVAAHKTTPTANLLAPIVVNLRTRRTAQCLNPEGAYSHQHELLAAMEAAV
jgi:flagellar assembly factor FliW